MTRPLALDLPLQGRQWIEASAGTGKTFTLSLLVLRLLLEREIALPNILAVTFTKAATQELKIKIRAQIKLAQDLLQTGLPEDIANLDAGKQATSVLLKSLLQEKPQKQLLNMLELAVQDCDRASIFTIHGFCARVLNEHALSAGQVLQTPSLLTSTAALNTKIAFDLWREFSLDRDLMRSLIKLWPSPELLARQCDALLQAENLLPALPQQLPNEFDMRDNNQALRTAFELHMDSAKALMAEAQQAGILHGSHMSPDIVDTSFGKLEYWYSLVNQQVYEDPDFSRLSASYIASKVKKDHKKQTPVSPLFDAIEYWYQGFSQVQAFEQARDIHCLHLVRDRLRKRREAQLQKLQQYSYDDLITQLADALDGPSGEALLEDLRKQYPVALVDEFQDTDSQQWKIFSALYPLALPAHALYLIGDPKQAIYGFRGGDVHAYLAAKRESQSQWNLPENFRSRPGLLAAIAGLFDRGGENAFRESDIRFYPVRAGGAVKEEDFLWNDAPAPAMQLALLPEYIDQEKQEPAALPAGKGRELATRACVEKIHLLLSAGRRGNAVLRDRETGEMRHVLPGDIAVLVNQNREASQMRAALAACGIASVVGSQESLFASFEAKEIFLVLDALIQQGDQARWRGALSTLLIGHDVDRIRQLESDDVLATISADMAVEYRQLWWQQGVLSLVTRLCALAAPRILSLPDGERRLSNYLQLAETLQQASARSLGPEQSLHYLVNVMQESSVDEENTLRLDSDRKRVKIMTLHKSKGLEFPLVFMPFANFGKTMKSGAGLGLLNYHEQHLRITHALVCGEKDKKQVDAIKAKAAEEQLAEQVRLLYVGLTRAQYFCWVCCGHVYQADKSGFSSLLFRNAKDEIKTPSHAEFLAQLNRICLDNPVIEIDELKMQKNDLPSFDETNHPDSITITKPSAQIQLDWRVLSFSQMTHGSHQGPGVTAAADEVEPANVELSAADEVFDRRFSGIAFGNALHQVLENTRVDAWASHVHAETAPESELPVLHLALLRHGYLPDELEAGVAQLAPLVFNTLRTPLPEGLRLCDLPQKARLNEMEFHFSLRDCDSRQLLEVLKEHGVLQQREDFPLLRRLSGLMTGKIDLTYRHDGRFYICDYKSNRLPAYDIEHCLQAMRNSEYDFQALIYTVALHRWCKFRLRSDYEYEKHIGGIRYLFCRGLNAERQDGAGIVALRFDRALIERLELLLHPLAEQAA
ncbi:MAG TPA: exodeoxyribonuclease V subunit beta [Arenimonas sp.]|nr:exodeoxyribonuclease V subunit beta [Arenimonas sp.]HPW31387.1 exodeoxyribonuclease V subunit beta [Arenimonas sp.]